MRPDRTAQFTTLLEPATSMLAGKAQHWADLGCGSAVFTAVLASLLPAESRVTAIDKVIQQPEQAMDKYIPVSFVQADFEKDTLALEPVDGILMANSFHYTRDKQSLIKKLEQHFKSKKQWLLVEYDSDIANPWVPYPLSFKACEQLFRKAGYSSVKKLGSIASGFGGYMYAAFIDQSV
ncbi:MAG: class I SAM-dependent methyltransferase [Ferruginibacter sp.]